MLSGCSDKASAPEVTREAPPPHPQVSVTNPSTTSSHLNPVNREELDQHANLFLTEEMEILNRHKVFEIVDQNEINRRIDSAVQEAIRITSSLNIHYLGQVINYLLDKKIDTLVMGDFQKTVLKLACSKLLTQLILLT